MDCVSSGNDSGLSSMCRMRKSSSPSEHGHHYAAPRTIIEGKIQYGALAYHHHRSSEEAHLLPLDHLRDSSQKSIPRPSPTEHQPIEIHPLQCALMPPHEIQQLLFFGNHHAEPHFLQVLPCIIARHILQISRLPYPTRIVKLYIQLPQQWSGSHNICRLRVVRRCPSPSKISTP